MRSLFYIGLAVLLSLLCVVKVDAAGTYCLALPNSLPKGASCGNGINCRYGTYCDKNAICSDLVETGGSCVATTDCVMGTTCKGPAQSTRCVVNANPGESCNNDLSVSTPYCGTGTCSNGVCINGALGDTCIVTANCVTGLTCTNGICSNVTDGSACTTSNMCAATSYCSSNFICAPKKTTGICASASECAYGYGCIGISSSDQTQCVQYGSRGIGEYCGSNGGLFCKDSKRCTNSYCARKNADLCSGSGGCSYDEKCACEDRVLADGYGVCTSYPCYKYQQDYEECIALNCKTTATREYTGSCRNRNCAKEYQRLLQCSSASSLISSFSFVALVAVLVTFFSL